MSTATETPAQALERIQSAGFCENDALVIIHFSNCGIDPDDIDPRNNVLTYRAWKAKGRQVARDAKGFAFRTWIPCRPSKRQREAGEDKERLRPKNARVFHVSQTIPAGSPKTTRPDSWNNPALVKPGTYAAPEDYSDVQSDSMRRVGPHAYVAREEVFELDDDCNLQPVATSTVNAASDPCAPEVTCTCPAIGLVTNVDCPLHGGR